MLLIHPSDEMYGADRMLLLTVQTLLAVTPPPSITVWLPSDDRYSDRPLSRALRGLGCQVDLLDLPVLRRNEMNLRGIVNLARKMIQLRRRVAELRPDFVVVSTSALAPLMLLLKRVRSVVVHVHESWGRFDGYALSVLLRHARTVIAPSEAVVGRMPRSLRRRAVVVPNGTPTVAALPPRSGSDIVVLVASRWGAWKGYETLLAAWAQLQRDDMRLLVLGGAPPTGTSVDVTGLVARNPNRESIHIIGEVGLVDPYYQLCDVVIVPSSGPEPFGLVAIEGMARARPVICSATGGLIEIVTSNEGWLFEPGDAEQLLQILETITKDQIALRGALARSTFEARYSDESFGARMIRALGLAARS